MGEFGGVSVSTGVAVGVPVIPGHGVMVGLNIQTSFLTPPFGFSLFYLRGVAPKEVRTLQIYKGAAAFIVLQLAGLAIVSRNLTGCHAGSRCADQQVHPAKSRNLPTLPHNTPGWR